MIVVKLLLLTSLVLATRAEVINSYDQEFTFTCPTETQTVSYVYSMHSNAAEDRVFSIECREFLPDPSGRASDCHWTNYQNDYDQLLHFSCPTSHFINGMSSRHNNHYEDRIWKFRCCHIEDVHLLDCGLTGWTNQLDGVQNFHLANKKVLTGVISQHNNYNEDRQYEYEFCGFTLIDDNEVGIIG